MKFLCCDVTEWEPPESEFDLVVSNFFLDCFRPEQIELIAEKISAALTDNARWLIADFCEPHRGWRKWRARIILQTMYGFFRWATALPARRLTAPDTILARHGFELRTRQTFEWGLLHSDLWVQRRKVGRTVPSAPSPFAQPTASFVAQVSQPAVSQTSSLHPPWPFQRRIFPPLESPSNRGALGQRALPAARRTLFHSQFSLTLFPPILG
jgi:hypothetical protein